MTLATRVGVALPAILLVGCLDALAVPPATRSPARTLDPGTGATAMADQHASTWIAPAYVRLHRWDH